MSFIGHGYSVRYVAAACWFAVELKWVVLTGKVLAFLQGMQRTPGRKTIEGELYDALLKAGCIPSDLSEPFSQVPCVGCTRCCIAATLCTFCVFNLLILACVLLQLNWNRAARTDKGVSAVGQVVSLDLSVEPDDTTADLINAHLPAQERLGRNISWHMNGILTPLAHRIRLLACADTCAGCAASDAQF